jgi:hypothetical protein
MSDDTIELVRGVKASLIPGQFPGAGVRWLNGYLCIGVAPTHPDFGKQEEGTIGSSTDVADEWRFDQQTGDMVSAYWRIPSVDAAWDDWRHVLELPLLGAGTLRLLDRKVFALEPAMIGAFDARGSALIAMMEGTRPADVEARLEIAPDVFLFVSGGRHCGWALLKPTDKGCLRGEELLPLPAEELSRARPVLAQTLAGMFELYSDDETKPVTLDASALERRLEELGAGLARSASPIASRVLMQAIERWYMGPFITPENAKAPWVVAEARQLKTGKLFKASDRDARMRQRGDLHPLIRERAEIEERLVRLHRQLRWPEPQVIEGQRVDSATLRDWIRTRPERIFEWLAAADIPPEVTGLSSLDQFARINDAVAELERQKRGEPLRLLDWVRFLEAIGTHAEVRAVHDALSAPAAKKPAKPKKGKPAAADPSSDAAATLFDLELTLTEMSLDDEAGDRHVGRCVHCQFITHGVKPDEDLERVEASGLGGGRG